MLHGEQQDLFDLSFAVPAECADRLADGRADIGIVPSVELNRQKLEMIRGTGIACNGPVRSILLISRIPFGKIRTLATDSCSRTSVALSRIVLARKFGIYPQLLSQPPKLGSMLAQSDAALIIGDAALLIDPAQAAMHVLDLGEEWTKMTGFPMVFAVWAARAELPPQDPEPFIASLRFGKEHLEDIVRQEHAKIGIPEILARRYLSENIVYELGDREYAGLSTFLRLAAELPSTAQRKTVSV
jgi:chorismate dehydratase